LSILNRAKELAIERMREEAIVTQAKRVSAKERTALILHLQKRLDEIAREDDRFRHDGTALKFNRDQIARFEVAWSDRELADDGSVAVEEGWAIFSTYLTSVRRSFKPDAFDEQLAQIIQRYL
jgi:hypothetical protein